NVLRDAVRRAVAHRARGSRRRDVRQRADVRLRRRGPAGRARAPDAGRGPRHLRPPRQGRVRRLTETAPSVFLRLWTAAHMAERVVARHLQEAGVSGEQLALLSLIATDEPITPNALGAELGVPLTTLADALRRLDARGELERSPNPADQRSHLITLSGEGRRRLQGVGTPWRKAA